MNVWHLLEETSGALQPACTTHAHGASQPVGEDVAKTVKTKHRAIRVLCWGNFSYADSKNGLLGIPPKKNLATNMLTPSAAKR